MAAIDSKVETFLSLKHICTRWAFLFTFFMLSAFSQAQDLPSIDDTVANASRMEGYFNLYWEESSGKMYWEIDKLDTEFLYQISMGSGLGSNPVGIDRGQLRGTYVLAAKRVGPRILLVQPNYQYRASSDNVLERQAVEDAFAPSVHWGFDIVAVGESSVLVDATDFFLRDAKCYGCYRRQESRRLFPGQESQCLLFR
jgi:hypothetical protein